MDSDDGSKSTRIGLKIEIRYVPTILAKMLKLVDDECVGTGVSEVPLLSQRPISISRLRLAHSALHSPRKKVLKLSHAIESVALELPKFIVHVITILGICLKWPDPMVATSNLWLLLVRATTD